MYGGRLGATAPQPGVVLQPKAVTIDVGGELVGYSAINMIDQSGLSTKYRNGVTDFDTYVGLKPLHAFDRGEWLSQGPTTTALRQSRAHRGGSRTGDLGHDDHGFMGVGGAIRRRRNLRAAA
jgi:hypothetical protein